MRFNNLLVCICCFLGGCASTLPKEISTPIDESPSLSDVRQDSLAHQNARVRWGGSIASIENKQDQTWLVIVDKKLRSSGKPQKTDKTDGRFLVKIDKFLEPEIYSKGRLVTVYGTLDGEEEGAVGEQSYTFPVIKASTLHLWPEYIEPQPYPFFYRPYYYDPFWDPYWDRHWQRHFIYGRNLGVRH